MPLPDLRIVFNWVLVASRKEHVFVSRLPIITVCDVGVAARCLLGPALLCVWAGASFARASEEPAAHAFDQRVQPLLDKYCGKCHGPSEPQGDFAIGTLTASIENNSDRQRWSEVLARVESGEMPPKDNPQATPDERRAIAEWVERQLSAWALAERQSQGRTVLRRLNRVEYESTVCDLLNVKTDLKDLLALDGSAAGFDNVGSALHISSFALERYLEAGDKALRVAIANEPQPPLFKKRLDLREQLCVKNAQEKVFRHLDDAVVLQTSSPWTNVWVSEFYPPDGGMFRIRVSASAFQSEQPITFRIASGELRGKSGLIGYFDARPGEPREFEVVVRLEPRSTLTFLPYGLIGSDVVVKAGADKYTGPGVAIQWVEIEGPLHESWPPPSHVGLFGDMRQEKFPSHLVNDYREVVSDSPESDARTILKRFLRRAFRRSVHEDDVRPYLELVRSKLEQGHRFEQAIRVALLGALVSDRFLFLHEAPGPLDDFALASRLSYFLWSSMPDDELLDLAERGELKNPGALRDQVERMLNHPQAAAFVENFVGQWLRLREIDFTEPNYLVYPEFDHLLKVSMIRETELFFAETLKHDLGVANFIDSDFSMLNGRLARHYGIPGPAGWEFQRVALPKGSHRGGLLTMASVLKVTANGSYTHPVHRGVWVLERLLGKRPANPPANVPVVEPDIRGSKGIRDLLAKHREGGCASCHQQIDPPGFALESFDVIGGWREHYRSTGNGEPVVLDGRQMNYLRGPPVECADELPDGRKFRDIDEYKQLLLADTQQVARALTKQLVTYATGASPESIDADEIEKLVATSRETDYGVRSLIHAIVQSPLFLNK